MKERLTRIEKMHIQDVRVLVKMTRKRLFYVSFLRQTSDKSVTWRPIGRCAAANFPVVVKPGEVVIKRTISAQRGEAAIIWGLALKVCSPSRKSGMFARSLFWQ
jgi:hypothetical protein